VLVLDAIQVLQFKTDQLSDVKKLDEMHRFFLCLMSGMDPAVFESSVAGSAAAAEAAPGQRRSKRRN
jgi:hypothetical protein